LGRGCSPNNHVEDLEERSVSSLSGARSEALATWPFRFIGLQSGPGVDFEDIYFSEVFVGSEPQNTPTYNQIFVGVRTP